jgi:hypothetical protein
MPSRILPFIIIRSWKKMTVNVTNVSKSKISDEVGMDKSYATFTVDEDFVAYEFSIDGTSHESGTDIEDVRKNVETYQSVLVSTVDDMTVRQMRAFLSATPITVEIDDSELIREGENHITVYAKSLAGVWTTH